MGRRSRRLARRARYANEPAPKFERLFAQMNLQGIDPSRIPGGKGGKRNDPHIVWGAVAAAKMSTPEEALLVYMATGQRESLHTAWKCCLDKVIELRDCQGWKVNKPGILDSMALTVVYDVCSPHYYDEHSGRRWAEELNLQDHKDWAKRWQPRYQDLRQIVCTWANEGIEKLERQFPGDPVVRH